MPTKININVGTKVGEITIFEECGYTGKKILHRCECSCGTILKLEKSYLTRSIKDNKHISCGHLLKKDLTNQRFGRLIALKDIGTQFGKRLWRCKCDCGSYTNVVSSKLIENGVLSCGCKKHDKGKHRSSYRGCGDLSGYVWSGIRSSAQARNLSFDISIEYAWHLFCKQNGKCALSGESINLYDSRRETRSEQHTASLDRIDSSLGYIEGNVQWVHKDINKMKNNFSDKHFIDMCIKIAMYQERI